MTILTRVLLLVIFFLALLTGAMFSVHVLEFTQRDTQEELSLSFQDAQKSPLSRLSLFPFFSKKRELIATIIENHEIAREHHAGLKNALFIEEFMVEGYISRFMVLHDRASLPPKIGPVRSLRPYFISSIVPWARVLFHAGGSPEALSMVQDNPEILNINGLYYSDDFLRDDDIPAPHNLFVERKTIRRYLPKYMPRTQWPPYETGSLHGGEEVNTILLNFFSSLHNVVYDYDQFAGRYSRTNGKIISDARPKNVLILEMPIRGEGEYGRLKISVEGSGKAKLFRNGQMFEGTWSKEGLDSEFVFMALDGSPMVFERGLTWMTVLPTMDRVSWE